MGRRNLFPILFQRSIIGLAFALSLGLGGTARAQEAKWSWTLAVSIQPLRPPTAKPQAWAAALRPLIAAHKRGQFAAACRGSAGQLNGLLRQAAKIFYAVDRKSASSDAIETFLDRHVRGERPVLEIGPEGFIPASPWRALAADACLRAADGAQAVRFAAGAASLGDTHRLALAVALAARTQHWRDADLRDLPESTRSALLRALAQPSAGGALLKQAKHLAKTAEDQELISAVAQHLGQP